MAIIAIAIVVVLDFSYTAFMDVGDASFESPNTPGGWLIIVMGLAFAILVRRLLLTRVSRWLYIAGLIMIAALGPALLLPRGYHGPEPSGASSRSTAPTES